MEKILNRYSNGQKLTGVNVVPADLIALVGGVSFGSVLKVLLAVNAISATLKIPIQDLLDLASIPEAPASEERVTDTNNAADKIAASPIIKNFEPLLHFIERRSVSRHRHI